MYKLFKIFLLIVLVLTGCGGGGSAAPAAPTKAPCTTCVMTTFSLNGVNGVINEATHTITVAMPMGANITAAVATFISTGATVKINGVIQSSGVTPNDFSAPLGYSVIAADGNFVNYIVTVSVPKSTAKTMTSFTLNGVAGIINETNKTIAVSLPIGSVATNAIATFTTTGAAVKINGTVQSSGVTPNNFTNPLGYSVVAADGSFVTYNVTVTVALATTALMTSFSIKDAAGNIVAGTINEVAKTIAVTLPIGTNLTALIANFSIAGGVGIGAGNVKIGVTPQTSGITPNNFTAPLGYAVVAADGITTATYIVTVTAPLSPAKALTSFALAGVVGTIDEAKKTILVTLPYGTASLTNLVATFTTTSTAAAPLVPVHIANVPQTSGVTANSFVNIVPYTVVAADGSFVTYNVTAAISTCPTAVTPPRIQLGNYTLFNNHWGQGAIPASAVTTCMQPSTATQFASWDWSWPVETIGTPLTVKAYPEILYTPNGSPMPPIPISGITTTLTLNHSVTLTTTTPATATNTSGDYNITYDIWIDPPTPGLAHKAELMIKLSGTWLDVSKLVPAIIAPPLVVNGVTYQVVIETMTHLGGTPWTFISFMAYNPAIPAANPQTQIGAIPLKPFIDYLILNQASFVAPTTPVLATDQISSIEFGTEIVQGSGNIIINTFGITP